MSTLRKLPPGRIIAATHNPGKVKELGVLLADIGFAPVSAGELGLPEPDETADTFQGNAELKALAAAVAECGATFLSGVRTRDPLLSRPLSVLPATCEGRAESSSSTAPDTTAALLAANRRQAKYKGPRWR